MIEFIIKTYCDRVYDDNILFNISLMNMERINELQSNVYIPSNNSFYVIMHFIFFVLYEKSFNYDLKCNDCQQKLEIFKDNYKCIECNHFFCQKCAIIHEKGDVDNILIHIYEVANICEKHCELFTTFCGLCKMNLCNICKQEHYV